MGMGMVARNYNPAVSAEQYRLAQAVLSGTARDTHMPVSVAREIVDRTPARLRSEYSRYTENPGGVEVELSKHHHFLPFSTKKAAETMKRLLQAEGVKATVKKVGGEWGVDHTHANPFYGTDLDLETSMVPAWMYYGSKEERDTAARMYEGRGKKVVLGHSMFGFKEGGGKKWRLRGVDHRGNPSTFKIGDRVIVRSGKEHGSMTEKVGTIREIGTSALGIQFDGSRKIHKWYTGEELAKKNFFDPVTIGLLAGTGLLVAGSRKRHNPKSSSDDMYASFHGESTDETIEFQSEEHYHSHLAALGELVELKVKLVGGGRAVIGFESGSGEESDNPQKWLLPFRRGKKNYEDVGYLPYALEHDIGFGGDKMYRPVKYENGQITSMSSELAGAHYDRYSRKSAVDAVKYLAAGMGKQNPVTGNPFWPFNSFTKTTIYHVGTGEKYKASGTYKGYTLYRKLDSGEFLVPALDKDSRFDTVKDAKEFVNSWTKHQKNPGGPLDTHAAKELELFVENDADLYRQQYTPINKNLVTKMARGIYNHAGAVKLFGYLMESGAKKYAKEYSVGTDWHQIFSPATRKHVAELFATHFETEAKLGNYDNYLPKKYAGWREKKNPKHGGPFREAGKLLGRGTRAVSRPLDDFTGAVGKVGGYLDDELGRALNPGDTNFQLYQDAQHADDQFQAALVKEYGKRAGDMRYQTAKLPPHIKALAKKFQEASERWHREMRREKNPSDHSTDTTTYLTVNEDGTQLFITGGDQSLDLPGLGITGPEADKELITVGSVTNIVYHAHKIFSGKREEYDYTHKFSEDSGGPLPDLLYDRISKHLKLSGGVYKIERPLVGTSPGIED